MACTNRSSRRHDPVTRRSPPAPGIPASALPAAAGFQNDPDPLPSWLPGGGLASAGPPVPAVGGTAGAARRHHVGRRAGHDLHRTRPDAGAEAVADRRALARPFADPGQGELQSHPPYQRARYHRAAGRAKCASDAGHFRLRLCIVEGPCCHQRYAIRTRRPRRSAPSPCCRTRCRTPRRKRTRAACGARGESRRCRRCACRGIRASETDGSSPR